MPGAGGLAVLGAPSDGGPALPAPLCPRGEAGACARPAGERPG